MSIGSKSEYNGIENAEQFNTKIAGVSFEGRQAAVRSLGPGVYLRLEREPDNKFDPNAIAVYIFNTARQVGYLKAALAAHLAGVLDGGAYYYAVVTDVTGGDEGKSLGVNISVTRAKGYQL